jgi:hypothetical protein
MSKTLAFASIVEALTGGALAIAPSLVTDLLLGAEVTGIAVVTARVAGVALIGLALACWPAASHSRFAILGMLTYSTLVAAYLAYLGVQGDWVGPGLWPAVAIHAVMSMLLLRETLASRVQSPQRQNGDAAA